MILLAFAYWELSRFFSRFLYDDGYSEWKALAIICSTQILAVMLFVSTISVLLGHRVKLGPKGFTLVLPITLSAVITAANYFALRFRNRSAKFFEESEHYTARVRTLGAIAVFLSIGLIAIVSLLVTGIARHLPH